MENNNFTYDAWKEYLKSDKEMNIKWKSLIDLWENVKKSLKENLNSLPYWEALKRRRFLTAKNIFNIINTAREKPNFDWRKKLIYNEADERDEYVIQCLDSSSDYLFRRVKEERGVVSMFWESIDKYLQPVADKIWALKETLRVSIQPEVKPSNLSYEAMKTTVKNENTAWDEVSQIQSLKWEMSRGKEPIQLTIQFPEDDWNVSETMKTLKDVDPNLDELYKFDPEVERYWNR